MTIMEPLFTAQKGFWLSSANQNEFTVDRMLASKVAELFGILHPAIVPMLERMFEDVKQDAETDGESELKRLAQIGITAAKIALREQEALDT
jgi:hypothetical protein